MVNGSGEVDDLRGEIEHLRAEVRELRETQTRLNLLVDHLPIVPFTREPTGDFATTYIADRVLEVTGYRASRFIDEPAFWVDHVHPDDREHVLRQLSRPNDEERLQFEYRWRIADGTYRWLLAVLKLVKHLDGRPSHYVGVLLDVTARKQAELEAVQAKQFYESLFETVRDPLVVVDDTDMRLLSANRAFHKAFALGGEDVEGSSLLTLGREGQWDTPEFRELMSRVAEEHTEVVDFEVEQELSDGEQRVMLFNARNVYRPGNDTRSVLLAIEDITDRRKAEEQLRRSEERFRLVSDLATDGIWDWNLETDEEYMSPKFKAMFGYEDHELPNVPASWQAIIHPEDMERAQLAFEAHAERGEPYNVDVRYFHKDGSIVWVICRGEMVRNEDGKPVRMVGTHTNITKLKEEQESLERQVADSAEVVRSAEQRIRTGEKLESIGRLAGGVAHDFNNMLSAILGHSELALAQLEDHPAKHHVELVLSAGKKSATLTRQLLAVGRKQMLRPQATDLNRLVRSLESLLMSTFGETVTMRFQLAQDLGLVRVDPALTEQAILNLALNARDAMPKGGQVTIETNNVRLDEEYAKSHPEVEPGRYVMLAVTDTGDGMDEETLAHVFEPFFTTKAVGEGTGLGLASVHGFVKQSQGSIWAYSELGQGTTFKIYLPRVTTTEDRPTTSIFRKPPRGSETVLLAEDNEFVRNLLVEVLESAGYKVLVATNGEEALVVCREHLGEIHIIVTDVVMPGMGGKELVEKLPKERAGVRVLYTSGYTENAIVQHGVLAPEVNFIQKPITPALLLKKVREVLDATES